MPKQRFQNIESMYNEYLDTLYSYACHLGFDEQTSMDAIHDVFYKLCTKYESLNEIINLKFYLTRSLRNRLIDIHRANKMYSDPFVTNDNLEETLSFNFNVTVEDELIMEEDAEVIRKSVENVLNRLTDRQREIIYLRYIQEYSYEEVAEIMQISVAACRNLVSRSLTRIKEFSSSIALFLAFLC